MEQESISVLSFFTVERFIVTLIMDCIGTGIFFIVVILYATIMGHPPTFMTIPVSLNLVQDAHASEKEQVIPTLCDSRSLKRWNDCRSAEIEAFKTAHK